MLRFYRRYFDREPFLWYVYWVGSYDQVFFLWTVRKQRSKSSTTWYYIRDGRQDLGCHYCLHGKNILYTIPHTAAVDLDQIQLWEYSQASVWFWVLGKKGTISSNVSMYSWIHFSSSIFSIKKLTDLEGIIREQSCSTYLLNVTCFQRTLFIFAFILKPSPSAIFLVYLEFQRLWPR